MTLRGSDAEFVALADSWFPVTPPSFCASPALDLAWINLSSRYMWDSLSRLEGVGTVEHLLLTNARHVDRLALRRLADLCPRTRVLDLRRCPQLEEGDLSLLGAFPQLEALKLGDNPQLGDAAIDGVLRCQFLRFLELVNASGLSGSAITRLEKLSGLESLLLGGAGGVDDRCVRRLCGLNELRDLRLVRCPISDRALSEIGRCRRLRHLNINGCAGLGDVAVAALVACEEIIELRMAGCRSLTDKAWRHLLGLPRLRALSLSGAIRLSDAGVPDLGHFADMVELRARACSGLGYRAAVGASDCRRLRVLDAAGWTKLTSTAVAALASLPYLSECALSRLDDRDLSALGANRSFEVLALRQCVEATAMGFANLVRLGRLKRLILTEGTPIDSAVLRALCGHPSLRELILERDPSIPPDSPTARHLVGELDLPFRVVERAFRPSAIVPERLVIATTES
jgi:hypothetical protein